MDRLGGEFRDVIRDRSSKFILMQNLSSFSKSRSSELTFMKHIKDDITLIISYTY